MALYLNTLFSVVQHLLNNWKPTVIVVVSFLNNSKTNDGYRENENNRDILQTVIDASRGSLEPHSRVTFVDLHPSHFKKAMQCYDIFKLDVVQFCVHIPDYVLGAKRTSQLLYIHLLGSEVTSNDDWIQVYTFEVLNHWAAPRYQHRHLFIVPAECQIVVLNTIYDTVPGALVAMYNPSVVATSSKISAVKIVDRHVADTVAMFLVSTVCTVLYSISCEQLPTSSTSPWTFSEVKQTPDSPLQDNKLADDENAVPLRNIRHANICLFTFTYQKYVKSDFNASNRMDFSAPSLPELMIHVISQFWAMNITRIIMPAAINKFIPTVVRYGFMASNMLAPKCTTADIQMFPVSRIKFSASARRYYYALIVPNWWHIRQKRQDGNCQTVS